MLQLVALFGVLCGIIGGVRLSKAAQAPEPKKAKSSAIAIIVFAVVLVGIGVFGAPIAIKLSGL